MHARKDGTLEKRAAIDTLATLLSSERASKEVIRHVLQEREDLQSTGIGEGVAIPHAALAELEAQSAALLIVPDGVAFDAIDGGDVYLLFSVIGPKRATGEHLKTLARVSRLLRSKLFREQLIGAPDGAAAYELIAAEERGRT
ncbi:MAG: PTS sugar transporter subunit IIA [Polyangiaceae bacterium]